MRESFGEKIAEKKIVSEEKRSAEPEKKVETLTPKERYLLETEAAILKSLEPGSDLALLKKQMRGNASVQIEKLKKAGIIETAWEVLVEKINLENLEKLWDENSNAGKILRTLEKSKELSVRQIAQAVGISHYRANDIIYILQKSGLVNSRIENITGKKGRPARLFFLPAEEEAKRRAAESSEKMIPTAPEEEINDEERWRNLKEHYLLTYPSLAKEVKFLKENPDFLAGRIEKRGEKKLLDPGTITQLERQGIIRLEGGRVKEINLDKFWEKSLASKIVELIEKEKFLTAEKIAEATSRSILRVYAVANDLVSAGLIREKKIWNNKIFYPLKIHDEKFERDVKKIKNYDKKK